MLRALLSDRFIRAGSWFFLAAAVSNLSNYIFQVLMGRLLTPPEYGLMNSLLAIFMVAGIPLGTILMVISKETAECKAKGEEERIRALLRLSYRRLLSLGLGSLLVFSAASSLLTDYLHAPSVLPVLLLGVALFVSVAPLINQAVLQGMQNFRWMNVGIALFGPLKLAFAVILVVAGLSVSGVMAALLLTAATLLVVTGIPVYRDVGKGDAGSPPHLRLAHTFPVLVANVAFSMMTQADMVLVKNLFSPQDAGLYASASVLGKAVIYLPGAIVLALFPMVAESNALRISSGSLLRKALVITLALSGGMALALLLFPALVVETLYGVRYLDAAGILKFFGLAMLPMALLLILMNYFIAKGRTLFSYAMGLGAVIEVALILAFHSSLTSVIWAIMGTGGVVLALGFVLVYVEGRIERREFGLCGEHR